MLSYTIDQERRLVVSVAIDSFTTEDALDHLERLKEDPSFQPEFGSLLDLSGIENLNLGPQDIRTLASLYPRSPYHVTSRRAVVAPTAHSYGMMRRLQQWREAESGHATFQVFRDRESALRWLLEAHSEDGDAG